MPFTSINLTNPRTNPWNFHKKILRIGDFEKRPFWKISHFEFFSWKFFFFYFILMKIISNLYDRMDGSNICCYPCFPANSLLCVIKRYTVYVSFQIPGQIRLIWAVINYSSNWQQVFYITHIYDNFQINIQEITQIRKSWASLISNQKKNVGSSQWLRKLMDLNHKTNSFNQSENLF